ncbi:glycoside hydrolase family 18 protein [Flagelloscypha sp. PMI_526]|nr:glycoside hydrolase family 18 protein [Flagelloscypha sp. PMI_526]
MAYFADWTVFERSPESINWTKFDVINFAFAVPNERFDLTWDDPNSSPGTLRRLVDSVIPAGKKVVMSVGGWTGSKYFSPAVATDESRKIFVNNIVQTYHEFNLSGIDIDWEYPGHQGEGGNLVSSNDTANCLTFFQLLRSSLPTEAILTAAVTTFPFVDDKGKPMADVSAFAAVLDSVTIMAYDTFGSSQNPGPNAPFSDSCKNSTQPQANAVAAYNAWTSAGFPAAKLILGIASYGYRSASSATRLQSRDEGQVTFNTLVKQGKLVKTPPPSGDPTGPSTFAAGPGYTRDWDACSSTPFIYGNGEVYTYDDPESLRMKATWVKEVGMGGVNMWSLDGDAEEGDLVGAVSGAFEHD